MRYRRELKFPCGYEIKEDIKIGLLTMVFGEYNMNSKIPEECPLHQNKCKGNEHDSKK